MAIQSSQVVSSFNTFSPRPLSRLIQRFSRSSVLSEKYVVAVDPFLGNDSVNNAR
jgi:hypothetical protein